MRNAVLAYLFVAFVSSFMIGNAQAKSGDLPGIDFKNTRVFRGAQDVKDREGLYSPFWVCVTAKQIKTKVLCEDLGIHEWEGPKADLQIVLTGDDVVHEYGLRHAVPLMECSRMRNKMKMLLRKSGQACFRGSYAWHEHEAVGRSESFGWVFFEFRTELGVVADCEEC